MRKIMRQRMKETFKRGLIGILGAALLLSGCGRTEAVIRETMADPQGSEIVPDESEGNSDISVEEKPVFEGETVVMEGPYGAITLTVPEGWKYELCEPENEKLLGASYGIHLYPEGETAGFLEIGYQEMFGVCGTGLEEKEGELAGCSVRFGYYDGNPDWEFITFQGEKEHLVVLASETAEWKNEKAMEEALPILDTLGFLEDRASGAIGIYDPESEIEELSVMVSATKITREGAVVAFRSYDGENGQTCTFTEEMILERKNADDSYSEAEKISEPCFQDLGHILMAGEEASLNFNWMDIYGSIEAGEYRIKVTVNGSYDAYAHFLIR